MKESHGMENHVLDVPPCHVIPSSPAVRAKVDQLISTVFSDLNPTAGAVAGCEAEHNTMSTFNIALNNLLEIMRII